MTLQLLKKDILIKRAGVRIPWTLPWIRPCNYYYYYYYYNYYRFGRLFVLKADLVLAVTRSMSVVVASVRSSLSERPTLRRSLLHSIYIG